ncbi:hypothetical protein BGZ70_002936 [Mortierella alpina]|uniref:SWIM-type domain-containing protein n=1 Tax=Mortierella alpina TaxID=64518 RepID=A0A9P6LVN4_MORAP|nr:hypothetical protein BGZ70_002936 [Mortierella alpina]
MDDARAFGERLQSLVVWIKNCAKEGHDPAFTKWFMTELCTTPGIKNRVFLPLFPCPFPADTESLFVLKKESWLDDGSLEIVLDSFRSRYGRGDRNLFVPVTKILLWMRDAKEEGFDSNWHLDGTQSGVLEKVFVIVPFGNHWGSLCIDFVRRQVFFGDSLFKALPCTVRDAIVKWLAYQKVDLSTWDPCIRMMAVPTQPSTSGSCGVIACNAIERAIDPSVPCWSEETAACHRLRLLRILTGFPKISQETECLLPGGIHCCDISSQCEVLLEKNPGLSRPLYEGSPEPETHTRTLHVETRKERARKQVSWKAQPSPTSSNTTFSAACRVQEIAESHDRQGGQEEVMSSGGRDGPESFDVENTAQLTDGKNVTEPFNVEDTAMLTEDESVTEPPNGHEDIVDNKPALSPENDVDEAGPNLNSQYILRDANNNPVGVSKQWRPRVGQWFMNLEEAQYMLQEWALNNLFEIVIGSSKSLKDGCKNNNSVETFQCSRYGQPRKHQRKEERAKDKNDASASKAEAAVHRHPSTQRCGCGVSLNVKFLNGLTAAGEIILFNDKEHNHPLRPHVRLVGRQARQLDPVIQEFFRVHGPTCKDTRELRGYLEAQVSSMEGVKPTIPVDPRVLSTAVYKVKRSWRVLEEGSDSQQLLDILQARKAQDPDFFFASDVDFETKELRMVFWMTSLQKDLYRRYKDVLVMDNTAQTNSLNLPLTAIVIMCDHEPVLLMAIAKTLPATRIVHCIWHIYAHNIRSRLVGSLKKDFDPFMRASSNAVGGRCSRTLGYDNYAGKYLKKLYSRRERWAQYRVKTVFTAGMQATQRVEKTHDLIKNNSTGPMSSLKVLFHAIDKRVNLEEDTDKMAVDKDIKKSPFLHVDHDQARRHFRAVIDVNAQYLSPNIRKRLMDEMATSTFYDCRQVGDEGRQAETTGRALNSVLDDVQDQREYFSDEEEYDKLDKRSKVAKQDCSEEDENVSGDMTDDDEIDDIDDDDYVGDSEEEQVDNDQAAKDREALELEKELKQAELTMEKQRTISRDALLAWIAEIGTEKICKTYQVYHELPPKRPHYVVLLNDQSHLCTCRLLQSKGLVCGHFFRLMRSFPEFRYHISLIPSRWFMEALQDRPDLRTAVMEQDAVYAESFAQRETSKPSSNFRQDYFSVFPSERSAVDSQGVPSSRSMRYGRLHGKLQLIISEGAESETSAQLVEKMFDQTLAEMRGVVQNSAHSSNDSDNDSVCFAGDDGADHTDQSAIGVAIHEGVQDVKSVARKGRKRKLRYKAASEIQIASLKKGIFYAPPVRVSDTRHGNSKRRKATQCGHCNSEGHNARTCNTAMKRR